MHTSHIATEAARLKPLAEQVMKRYDLDVREITHLATHSNVMYRVIAKDGRQMVLRVGTPSANTRSNLRYETEWLVALNRDTDLDLVRPLPTVSGRFVTDVSDPLTGHNRPCVLFTWVPGSPVGVGAGTFAYRMIGAMSAQLQLHGKTWLPEDPVDLRHWDRVFYYDESQNPLVIFDGHYDHLFRHTRRALIEKVIPVVEEVIKNTWEKGEPQIVHGDLHEWNVHLVGTRLYAFDFEDVMIATPAQDVSVCLYSSRAAPRTHEIRNAFREGFEQFSTWPIEDEEQLDGLHAARQLMLMNYAARTLSLEEAMSYLEQVFPQLESYLDRYV
jgi:Ser/Thr protein kinase RdoA (MazF antagonist)